MSSAGAVSEIDMRAVVESMADLVLVTDDEGRIVSVNLAAERILGLPRDEWVGRSVFELVHPDDVAEAVSSMGSMATKDVGTPVEIRVRDADGGWHLLEVIGTNGVGDAGIGGIVLVARDITVRRMWEIGGNDIARFQRLVQVSPSITLLLDRDGVVTSVNGAFTRLLGHDPAVVVGQPLASFVVPGSAYELRASLERLRRDTHSMTVEVPMRMAGADGGARPIRFEMINLINDPLVAGIVVTGSDVTDLQLARQELEHLARHDTLTGLANRALLVERLERQLEYGIPLAVLFIDLDRFKPINDLYGHESGDELLRLVARRLEHVVRPDDLVARVGGDEFVVVASGIASRGAATWLAERIEAALVDPYPLGAGPVRIGASVGVAQSDELSTVASLLADADIAMYDAKTDRRGVVARSMAERRRSAVERRRLAEELTRGLARGEIVAHLQPIIDLRTDDVVGLEALARWLHPQLGVLRPATFMDLVEDAGLDLALGDAVLTSACASMAALGDLGTSLQVGVNLSVGQLSDAPLVPRMLTTLDRHGLTPEQLVIEITEQTMLARRGTVGGISPDETLRTLHALGASLSLDDFGTGYSSLTHVRRFPLAALKIDQSFVAGVVDNAQDRAVIEVIVGLANALSLTVVAEGIETDEQLVALREIGCHHAQGYLIGLPMAGDVLARWLADRAARRG